MINKYPQKAPLPKNSHPRKLNPFILILAILWMAIIFAFSSRNAVTSTADSYRVGMAIGEIAVEDFKELPYEQQIEFAQKVDHPIRKCAHAAEYAILALLIFGAIGALIDLQKRLFISWLITTLYASSDEFHQLFVPGRAGRISDICIDSAGAIAMLLIIAITCKFVTRKKN